MKNLLKKTIVVIERLSVLNYKNLAQVDLNLSPCLNCFVGDNGEGKTNILDAVYYLAMGKSSSGMADTSIIRYGEPFFMLKGDFRLQEVLEQVSCGVKRGEKRQFQRNGKSYERISEHIGLIPLVLVSPQDSGLISEAAEERRKFLNASISLLNKSYLESVMRYNNLLLQRNKLLKQEQKDLQLFEAIDMQIAHYANMICEQRKNHVESFLPYFLETYRFISQSKEEIDLQYASQLLETPMEDLLRKNFERDRALSYTGSGIHRDDIRMTLNGHDIRRCGSQGQQKSFLIALKLAQYEQLRQTRHMRPLLLLDDVFDKLDEGRVSRLLQWVSSEDFGQLFITECNRERMNTILQALGLDHHLYLVKQGEVSLIQE